MKGQSEAHPSVATNDEFVKNYDRNITALQVLNEYNTIAERVKAGLTVEQAMTVIEKVVAHGKTHVWKTSQVDNIAAFMRDLDNGELVYALWNKMLALTEPLARDNCVLVHRACRGIIANAFGVGRRGAQPEALPAAEDKQTA